MFRFALSAVALAGVLVTAQPGFADPLAAAASDHAQAATPAMEQPAPIRGSSPDAPAPSNAGRGEDIIFLGFGSGSIGARRPLAILDDDPFAAVSLRSRR